MNHLRKTAVLTLLICAFAWPRAWSAAFDPAYSFWQEVLTRYTEDGRVAYETLKKNPALFYKAVENIESISGDEYKNLSRDAKMAYWINAYNAGAMKLVIENYPPRRGFSWKALAYPEVSIQQIPDVWKRPALSVMGEDVSLDKIEHETLRPEFKDARIHFAVVCASTGCPVLRSEAYTGERLDEQLDEQTRRFLNDPEKARYDSASGTLYLSPIFKWFAEDFEREEGSAAAWVKKRGGPAYANLKPESAEVKFLDYDWSLNSREE